MKQIFGNATLALTLAATPAAASADTRLEGQWRNPKGSVVVRVAPCGDSYCGTVIKATERAKQSARRGGTPNLVGTLILSDVRATGNGTFRGRAFDPKRNIRAPATIRLIGSSILSVKGCLISGMICKEQRWTRIS